MEKTQSKNSNNKKFNLATSTVYVDQKQGHFDSVISVAVNEHDPSNNIIASCSDDKSVRLWDLRQKNSFRLYRDPEFCEEFSNLVFTPNDTIIASSLKTVFGFDLKMDKIIVDKAIIKSKAGNDLINSIAIDKKGRYLSIVDDEGDATIFDPYTLETKAILEMQHKNICYTTDFVYQDQNYENALCMTAGFDCQIILWDMKTKAPIKHHNIAELTQKYIVNGLVNPPLIYSVFGHQQQILLSIESGHIICLSQKDLKKPKYIIDAHLGKVLRSVFAKFNENYITSISNDCTFSIFNQRQRNEFGTPEIVKKVQIPEKPNWMDTTINNQILITDITKNISIYTFKN